ncbi:heavy metal translocating P-type ATPase [Aureimonas glaciei]|nr:heavy metal translocating P-type ATPase [Aureimonas glaciei]
MSQRMEQTSMAAPLASAIPILPPVERGKRLDGLAGQVGIVWAGAGLAAGAAAYAAGRSDLASLFWSASALPVLVLLVLQILDHLRRGDVGLDLVAALAMGAALSIGEALAAAVVALMYAGGQALERFAEGRAGRDMNALLDRVPRFATRYSGDGMETVPIARIAVGDRLLVRLGDVLPVDGVVMGTVLLDEAALTGESIPVRRQRGEAAMSGSTNAGPAFDLVASEPAARSTYAGIVRLVDAALRAQAPMARLADRYALGFMLVTLVLAASAWWWSQDPIRAVAVLVVATPCPLILAVPVAIVAGISRAARVGILVKGGGALEALGRIRTLVVDKTGTLTHGTASVTEILPANGFDAAEILRLAASLDRMSQHVVARAIVAAAEARGLPIDMPSDTSERAGDGVEGRLGDRRVRVGGQAFVAAGLPPEDAALLAAAARPGSLTVAVSVDGRLAGTILMRDGLREGVGAVFARLRASGIRRIVLATGDRRDVALAVTRGLAIDEIVSDLLPAAKIELVRREKETAPVMMVGDGVNDAPALVEADLGIAMGAKGAAASAEAADIILLRDDLEGLAEGMEIARRSRRIALQSVGAGIGLSTLGMLAAAGGLLSPVAGALMQEAIDVAVILNALRALRA